MDWKKYLTIYRYHGGGLTGMRRIIDTFAEVDWFDIARGVRTAEIKTAGYSNPQYMFYAPAYTSVVREMLRMAFSHYTSAIRYTDFDRNAIFLDLGCGAGKAVIQAIETNHFAYVCGVDIDEDLVARARMNVRSDARRCALIAGNAEGDAYMTELMLRLSVAGINPIRSTVFVFNKNSYGPDVLRRSLEIVERNFRSVVYLYQNPVHHRVMDDFGYECFLADGARATAHKNFKYRLYMRHQFTP